MKPAPPSIHRILSSTPPVVAAPGFTIAEPAPQPEAEAERQTLFKRLGISTKKKSVKAHKTGRSEGRDALQKRLAAERSEPLEPSLQRHNSAPERRERPVRTVASHTATASDARAFSSARGRQHDLDRIDELDESSLFGISLHHDGRYEAVKSTIPSPPRMPLGYQNDGQLHQYHERMLKTNGHLYELPKAPDGVPLNLSPGQLLPRNFKREQRKAPRFRNIVSPLPAQSDSFNQQSTSAEPAIPPRHQNLNQIPFHNNPSSNGRRHRIHPAENDPLAGPPIDPSVIIGLAMMKDIIDTPPTLSVNEEYKVEGVEELKEVGGGDEEFNPYDPKNYDSAPLSDQPPPEPIVTEETDTPRISHAHLSEEEFHANAVDVSNNPQFEGLPAGVTWHSELASATPVSDAMHQGRGSPFPTSHLHKGALAGSEETLVQTDEESEQASAVVNSDGVIKPAVIIAKDQQGIHIHIEALPLEQTDHERMGAIAPIILQPHHAVSSTSEIAGDDVPAKSSVDDVGAASIVNGISGVRYDKQLPPKPPAPMGTVVAASPPPYRVESPYIPPHLRSIPKEVNFEQSEAVVQTVLQRSDTHSTQRSSTSYQSYSSTKGDDGHSHVTYNATAPAMVQKKVTLPTLTSNFGSETFNRYPQPPQKQTSQDQPRANVAYGARSQSRNGNSSASWRPLAPIQEDETLSEKLDRMNGRPSQHSSRSKPSRPDLNGKTLSNASYTSHIRVEVGQVYPQHLLPPLPTNQQQAFQNPPTNLPTFNPATQANNPPSMVPIPHASFAFNDSSLSLSTGHQPTGTHKTSSVMTSHHRDSPSAVKTQIPNDQNIPTDPSDLSPRSSTESERRPLRVVNVLSGVPELDEDYRQQSYVKTQITPPESQHARLHADNASSLRPEDSSSNRARSVTSYATSSTSLRPPFNRHMPKKLVMPAPLQPQHQTMVQQQAANQKQRYSDIFHPRPNPPTTPQQSVVSRRIPMVTTREPSPPHILPPILSQDYRPDAQAASRKLKKRLSFIPQQSKVGEIAPTEALNFEPVILPPEKDKEKPRLKQGSNRLSKRRTNL